MSQLSLLSVHAHPDDEASKGASTMARYAADGIRGVLVTCTGGEEGEVLIPEMDLPHVHADIAGVRRGELERAVEIIGYDRLHLLGYRDSGMPDSEANRHPDNFANAPLHEAVDRLARLLRAERPNVVVTYGEDQSRYPHPDHLRVHEITQPAIERAADTSWDSGDEPWEVAKLYWSNGFTRGRLLAMHRWHLENDEESPYAEWVEKVPDDADASITTRVDVGRHLDVGRDALRAHRTQVDPNGRWFRIPVEHLAEVHPWEEYTMVWSTVGKGPVDQYGFETDLFGGLR